MSNPEHSGTSGPQIKVARLLDEYDLDEMGEWLEARWTATGDRRMSLRELAAEFNQELLRTAISEAGSQPLDGEVENTYRLLTDEEITSADRTRTKRRLERDGVDVDGLRDDFVTYQAIRTYLTSYRDASYTADERDRATVEQENIQRLRGRVVSVTESKLDQLRRNGDVELGGYRTYVDINVLCEDCGERYKIDELLTQGGCNCRSDGE